MSVFLDESLFKAKPTVISTKGQGLGSRGGVITGVKKPTLSLDMDDDGVAYESDDPNKGLPKPAGVGKVTGPTIDPNKFKVSPNLNNKINQLIKALEGDPKAPISMGRAPTTAPLQGPSIAQQGQPDPIARVSTPVTTGTPPETQGLSGPSTPVPSFERKTSPQLSPVPKPEVQGLSDPTAFSLERKTSPHLDVAKPPVTTGLGGPTAPTAPPSVSDVAKPPQVSVSEPKSAPDLTSHIDNPPEGHEARLYRKSPNSYSMGLEDSQGRRQGDHLHFVKRNDKWHHAMTIPYENDQKHGQGVVHFGHETEDPKSYNLSYANDKVLSGKESVEQDAPSIETAETDPSLGVAETDPSLGVAETDPSLGVAETDPSLGVADTIPLPSKDHVIPKGEAVDYSTLTESSEPTIEGGSATGHKNENGEWHGPVETQHEDGTSSIEHYKDGIQHGPFERYGREGKLESSGRYVDGKLHGTHKIYGEEGKLAKEINYRHGKKHGHEAAYHDDGSLNTYSVNGNGYRLGSVDYHPDGSVQNSGGIFEGHNKPFKHEPHSLIPSMDEEAGQYHELPQIPENIASESHHSNTEHHVHPEHEPVEHVPSEFHPDTLEKHSWEKDPENPQLEHGTDEEGNKKYSLHRTKDGQLNYITNHSDDGSKQTAYYNSEGQVGLVHVHDKDGNKVSSHAFRDDRAHGPHVFYHPETGQPTHATHYEGGRLKGHAFTHDPETGEITHSHSHENSGHTGTVEGVPPTAQAQLDHNQAKEEEKRTDNLLSGNPDKELYHLVQRYGAPQLIGKKNPLYDHVNENPNGLLNVEYKEDGRIVLHGVTHPEDGGYAGIPHFGKVNSLPEVSKDNPLGEKIVHGLPDPIRAAAAHLPSLEAPPKDKLSALREFLQSLADSDFSRAGNFGSAIGHIIMSPDLASGVDFAYKAFIDGIPELASSILHSQDKATKARIRRERIAGKGFQHPSDETLKNTKKIHNAVKGLHENPDEVLGDTSHWSESRHRAYQTDLDQFHKLYKSDKPDPDANDEHNDFLKEHHYGDFLDGILRKHRDLGGAEGGYYARHNPLTPGALGRSHSALNHIGHVADISEADIKDIQKKSRKWSDNTHGEFLRSLVNGAHHFAEIENKREFGEKSHFGEVIANAVLRAESRTEVEEEARKIFNKHARKYGLTPMSKRQGFKGSLKSVDIRNPYQEAEGHSKKEIVQNLDELTKEAGQLIGDRDELGSQIAEQKAEEAAKKSAEESKQKKVEEAEAKFENELRESEHPLRAPHWGKKDKPSYRVGGYRFSAQDHPEHNAPVMSGDKQVRKGKGFTKAHHYKDATGKIVKTVHEGHAIIGITGLKKKTETGLEEKTETGPPKYIVAHLNRDPEATSPIEVKRIPVDELHARVKDDPDYNSSIVPWYHNVGAGATVASYLKENAQHINDFHQEHANAQKSQEEANAKLAEPPKEEKETPTKVKKEKSAKPTKVEKETEVPVEPEKEIPEKVKEAEVPVEPEADQALQKVLETAGKVGKKQKAAKLKEDKSKLPEMTEHATYSGALMPRGKGSKSYHIYHDLANDTSVSNLLAKHSDNIKGILKYTDPEEGTPKYTITSRKDLPKGLLDKLEAHQHVTKSHPDYDEVKSSFSQIRSHLNSLPKKAREAALSHFESHFGHSMDNVREALRSNDRHFINQLFRNHENDEHILPKVKEFLGSDHMQTPEVQKEVAKVNKQANKKAKETAVSIGVDPKEIDNVINITDDDFGHHAKEAPEEQLAEAAREPEQQSGAMSESDSKKYEQALKNIEVARERKKAAGSKVDHRRYSKMVKNYDKTIKTLQKKYGITSKVEGETGVSLNVEDLMQQAGIESLEGPTTPPPEEPKTSEELEEPITLPPEKSEHSELLGKFASRGKKFSGNAKAVKKLESLGIEHSDHYDPESGKYNIDTMREALTGEEAPQKSTVLPRPSDAKGGEPNRAHANELAKIIWAGMLGQAGMPEDFDKELVADTHNLMKLLRSHKVKFANKFNFKKEQNDLFGKDAAENMGKYSGAIRKIRDDAFMRLQQKTESSAKTLDEMSDDKLDEMSDDKLDELARLEDEKKVKAPVSGSSEGPSTAELAALEGQVPSEKELLEAEDFLREQVTKEKSKPVKAEKKSTRLRKKKDRVKKSIGEGYVDLEYSNMGLGVSITPVVYLSSDLFKADFKDYDRQKKYHDNSFNRHHIGVSPTDTPSDEEDDNMVEKSLRLYVSV